VLSNHGGRQLDFSRSGIEVLVEVVTKFKENRGITFPNERFQLFVDGGVRRATDVLKAVALGATAGMGSCFETFETCFKEISSDSGHWPTISIRIFLVWARWGRKGTENSSSMPRYIDLCR